MTIPRHANRPPKVSNHYDYWSNPPPELSARCVHWMQQIYMQGWRPNRRICTMGYDESSEWFGVYIWEYIHVIYPLVTILQGNYQINN